MDVLLLVFCVLMHLMVCASACLRTRTFGNVFVCVCLFFT